MMSAACRAMSCLTGLFSCAGGSTLGLPGDLLPNGMPALPADLQLDAPITLQKEGPKFSAAQASAEGSGFQGGLFALPSQPSNSMWQQFGQVDGQQPPQQQRTSAGLPQAHREQDSSDFSLGSKGAWGAPAVTGISPTPQSQLGAFSSAPSNISAGPPGLQFGQVMSGGFGAFVPTGECTAPSDHLHVTAQSSCDAGMLCCTN